MTGETGKHVIRNTQLLSTQLPVAENIGLKG